MKCPLGISNFLEEISSLSHSVVFLYFFALIAEEDFLISPCYSLELCIQMGMSFLFSSLLFTSLLYPAICKASSDSHFAFLHFFFLGMVLLPVSCTMSQTLGGQVLINSGEKQKWRGSEKKENSVKGWESGSWGNRGDGDSAEEKEEAGCRDRVGKREKKSQKLFMVFFFFSPWLI